ncbi:MAG: RdgB/HAM1 family non-canonical purine NTP pyrophosphatase [Clostridiales bacterium]|nr:RdgB/HAM1 family non-canonical purine NTP pyrophosphatase [Clostridiales bacterium]
MKETTFCLASHNPGKIAEMEALLRALSPDIRVIGLRGAGYEGDIEENGSSFEENAAIKAAVPAALGFIGIADDSGLCVDALGGAPGINSARYSGGGADENNEKLLHELRDVEDSLRTARFVSVIALRFPDNLKERYGAGFEVRGECEGVIIRERRGDGGFGYDPLFFYPPLGLTFAQLSAETKNQISHRAAAMRLFAEKLKEYR